MELGEDDDVDVGEVLLGMELDGVGGEDDTEDFEEDDVPMATDVEVDVEAEEKATNSLAQELESYRWLECCNRWLQYYCLLRNSTTRR